MNTTKKAFKVIGVRDNQPIAPLVKRKYDTRDEAEKAAARLLRQSNVARALAVPAR